MFPPRGMFWWRKAQAFMAPAKDTSAEFEEKRESRTETNDENEGAGVHSLAGCGKRGTALTVINFSI